jgi:hypothetical protein
VSSVAIITAIITVCCRVILFCIIQSETPCAVCCVNAHVWPADQTNLRIILRLLLLLTSSDTKELVKCEMYKGLLENFTRGHVHNIIMYPLGLIKLTSYNYYYYNSSDNGTLIVTLPLLLVDLEQ